jgi:hypothetical protein
MPDALEVAAIGTQPRGCARRGSPAADHLMGDDHGKRVPQGCRRARPVARQTSMSMVISQNDLSLPAASQSEALDKPCGIPVWSRTCYTHVE